MSDAKNTLPPRCPCGECEPVEARIDKRGPAAKQNPGGEWIKTKCRKCGRLFGYRPVGHP